MPLLACSCRFATQFVAGRFGCEVPLSGETAADSLGRRTHCGRLTRAKLRFSMVCDSQEEFRSCILGDDSIRAGDVLFAKLAVGGGRGYFRRDDELEA